MNAEPSEQARRQIRQLSDHPASRAIEMYREMYAIREFERTASDLNETGELPGPIHLAIGQEAVAVGSCQVIEDSDIIGSTHRGHGHVLAKGADVDMMMAELAGKQTGLNGGRGGSMHLVDFSLGIFGCNAIVGASVPHVAGGVLSSKLDGDDRVGLAFFGDGAANQGVVHETMNMAAIWDLPVVFLCENNQYAVSTPADDAVAGESIANRAEGYGFPGRKVNGQDVLAVYEAVSSAVTSAREHQQPHLIECETLRYSGHFSGEQNLDWLSDSPYRPEGEVDKWKRVRDPIATFRRALIETEVSSKERLDEIEYEVGDRIRQAEEFAKQRDHPPADKALSEVYADQDYPTIPATKYR